MCPVSHMICKEGNRLLKCPLLVLNIVSPFDFKYCVILIYRLKLSDRASSMLLIFGFHTHCCWGKRILSIEKSIYGDITNTPLAPSVGSKGLYFLFRNVLTPV